MVHPGSTSHSGVNPGVRERGWWRSLFPEAPFLFIGFMGLHTHLSLLYCFALFLRNAQFFGVKVQVTDSVISEVVHAFLLNTFRKTLPFALFFSLATALLLCLSAPKHKPVARAGWATAGVLLYLLLSLLLILPRPGCFIAFPLVRHWPYWACYLFFLFLVGATLYLLPTSHIRKALLLLFIAALELTPHQSLRFAWHQLHPGKNPGTRRILLLSLDSARLDEVRQHLSSGHSTYGGLSEFQSTRRQWLVMLGVDPARVENRLFIPSLQDQQQPAGDSDFEQDVRRNRYTMAFLLDDGSTANRQGLPLNLSEVHINGEGLESAGAPMVLPLAAWLQNILAPVEANNAFSDIDAFLADTREAMRRNEAVLAHTCYLEQSLSTLRHFYDFQGLHWLATPPIAFAFGGTRLASDRGVSPRAISSFKTRLVLEKAISLFTFVSTRYPGYSGLLTSDHGEDFDSVSGEHLPSTHGFSASPGCAWIPVVPFGATTLVPAFLQVPPTWRDLHASLLACLRSQGPWMVRDPAPEHWSAFPFIVPPLLPWDPEDRTVLTMQEISRTTQFTPGLGLHVRTTRPIGEYRKSYVSFLPGRGLLTCNPSPAGGFHLQFWRGYELIEQADSPPGQTGESSPPSPAILGRTRAG